MNSDPRLVQNEPLVSEFLEKSDSRELMSIRQKIINNLERISEADFESYTKSVAVRLSEHLQDRPYAVIYDAKPHSSRRWMWEKMRANQELNQPNFTRYLNKSEVLTGYSSLMEIFSSGVRDIVIADDAIYSGEQSEKSIERIKTAFNIYKDENPNSVDSLLRIYIAVPLLAEKFVSNLTPENVPPFETISVDNSISKITIYAKPMRQLRSILSAEDWQFLENRDYQLLTEKEKDAINSKSRIMNPLAMRNRMVDSGLTGSQALHILPHKIPDDHSFPVSIVPGLSIQIPDTPYKSPNYPFYELEEQEFSAYMERFCRKANSDSQFPV